MSDVLNTVTGATVFVLFVLDYDDYALYAKDEDVEYVSHFQGVFSTLENAKQIITRDIDDTHKSGILVWEDSADSLNGRRHYRTQMIEGSRYYIREAVIDKSDWSDIVETMMSRIKADSMGQGPRQDGQEAK